MAEPLQDWQNTKERPVVAYIQLAAAKVAALNLLMKSCCKRRSSNY